MESFWYDDISVLFDKNKLNKYIPLKSYTRDEKLNAIVRISIYISVLFLLLTGNTNYLFILIFSLVLTLINIQIMMKLLKNIMKMPKGKI